MEVLQRFCCKCQLFLDFVNKIYLPCCCVVFFVVCPLHGPISRDFCELSFCVGIHYQTTRRRSVNFSNFTIHLSVKFGWADRPPVKKLTSVFYASVLLFIVNFVITGIKVAAIIHELGDRQVDPRTTLTMLSQNLLSIMGQTREKLTSICFFTITNCPEIVRSRSFQHRINYKFMCLSALIDDKN